MRLVFRAAVAVALFWPLPGFAQSGGPAGSFGTPPPGEVPILFNDQHVYAKPDTIQRRRTLAALVKDETVLLPLRAMFEAMGATVSWDGATKTATVAKPGAEIKVTVGRETVWINGEGRPLDVAPEIYRDSVVVPVRVISEALGAYVQWVPEKHSVVVRYLAGPIPTPPPATPPPATPQPLPSAAPPAAPVAPPATPSVAPPPAPARAATRQNEFFVAADYLVSPKVYNELSPGNSGSGSYAVQGAAELLSSVKILLEGDWRRYQYPHNANQLSVPCAVGSPGCNTVNGNGQFQTGICPTAGDPGCVTAVGAVNIKAFNGLSQEYVNALTAQETSFDAHVGFKVFDPRIYAGAGYYQKSYNYLAYPTVRGVGAGITKLPDLERPVSLYGSFWYYPNVTGTYTYPTTTFLGPYSGAKVQLGYSVLKYQAGATVNVGGPGFFFKAGWGGESSSVKANAPANTSINAPFIGAGFRF